MNNNVYIPSLRFKEFTDGWETRKLWEITIWDKKFNGVESYKQTKVNKYPYVLAEKFNHLEDMSGSVRLLSTGSYIGYTTETKAGKNLCEGEIVAIPWGGVPNVKYYKGKYVTADNRIATSCNTSLYSNRYIALWLQSKIYILETFYRGVSIKHPSMYDVLDMEIKYPKIVEQEKISDILFSLDSLITIQQRKYQELQKIKKSLLNNMFPSERKDKPNIRFKQFTWPWKEQKLNAYLDVSNEINNNNAYGKRDVLSVSGDFGIVNQIKFMGRSYAGVSVEKYGVVHKGDVVYTKSPLRANPYGIIKANKGSDGIVSSLYGVYKTKENADANFLQDYFDEKSRLNNYLHPLINKGAKNTLLISDKKALEGYVTLAPTIEEQKKISLLFSEIDTLIDLYQCKYEKLQNIKEALLERMFV